MKVQIKVEVRNVRRLAYAGWLLTVTRYRSSISVQSSKSINDSFLLSLSLLLNHDNGFCGQHQLETGHNYHSMTQRVGDLEILISSLRLLT